MLILIYHQVRHGSMALSASQPDPTHALKYYIYLQRGNKYAWRIEFLHMIYLIENFISEITWKKFCIEVLNSKIEKPITNENAPEQIKLLSTRNNCDNTKSFSLMYIPPANSLPCINTLNSRQNCMTLSLGIRQHIALHGPIQTRSPCANVHLKYKQH